MLGTLLLALACAAAHAAGEPQVRFRVLGPEQGLPTEFISDVVEDSQGFLWLAALGQGLIRYDGHDLVVFRHEPDNENSLTHSEVRALATDQRGRIWISTAQGITSLDPQTMEFERWAEGLEDQAHLLVDRDGKVWFGTFDSGLFKLDPETGEVTKLPTGLSTDPGFSFGVNKIYQETSGRIWVGLASGLIAFDPGKDLPAETFVHDPEEPSSLPLGAVLTVVRDRAGALWVGGTEGIAVQEPGTKGFRHAPQADPSGDSPGRLRDQAVTLLHEDSSGRLWVGTARGGLHLLTDRESLSFEAFQPDPDDPYALGGIYIWNVHEAADGVLHFAAGGLSTLDPDTMQFIGWSSGQPEVGSGAGGPASGGGLALLYGDVYIGGGEGIHRLDPKTGEWTTFPLYPDRPRRVHDLHQSSKGGLWVGMNNSFAHFHPDEGYTHVTETESTPISIFEDKYGVVWAGEIFKGVLRYEPDTGELAHLKPDASDPCSLSHNAVWGFLEGPSRELWLATQAGLDRLDRATGCFEAYKADGSSGLPSEETRDLEFAEDRQLWVATDAGLALFDPRQGASQLTWTTADGLLSDAVVDIEAEGEHALWISTPRGLSRLDLRGDSLRAFTRADGLLGDNVDATALDDDGRLWIDTAAGLESLDLGNLSQPAPPPRLVLTRLQIDKQPRGWSSVGSSPLPPAMLTNLNLGHRDKVLQFRFSALDYVNPERVLYQYRLVGLDDGWSTLETGERNIIYTTLPQGRYQLQVRARNRDGVWSPQPFSLDIDMAPPPWRTWQAYLAYGLAAMLLFAGALAWRTRAARLHARELADEVRERTAQVEEQRNVIERQAGRLERELASKNRLFADISHEFRTPLTLIRGPLVEAESVVTAQKTRDRISVARRAAIRLERLVDQLLDLARLDAGQDIPRDPQPLGAHIESQVQAFRQLADEKGVSLATGKVEPIWVLCGADPLEKIVSNLISNAVKFTREGDTVTVDVVEDAGMGCLVVNDTGPGMASEVLDHIFERFERGGTRDERIPGAGLGLALVKQLTEACGGQIAVKSETGRGTEVRVSLPLASPEQDDRQLAELHRTESLEREIAAVETGPARTEEADYGESVTTVLVVEDNPDLATYLRDLLGERYAVEVVHDGEHGLERARNLVPDLVICDAMLPGVDGFEVCERLKGDTATSHVPILILTARADRDSRREAYRRHADDFLTKPFDSAELLQRVSNLLEIRNLLRERYGQMLVMAPSDVEELSSPDRRFLDRLTAAVEKGYPDPEFGVAQMASAVAMSERQLQRKLKAMTNNTPMEYLRAYRLERAKAMLEAGQAVGRVVLDVGFGSPSYFAKCFRARFGIAPGQAGKSAQAPD